MHVVWHYDVATNSDIVLLRFRTKNAKYFMHFWPCQQSLTFVGVKCDEVERANIVKQTTEPRRSPRPLYFVRRRHDGFLLGEKGESNRGQPRCSHGAVAPCG